MPTKSPEHQSMGRMLESNPSQYTLPLTLDVGLAGQVESLPYVEFHRGSVSVGTSEESNIAAAGLANWLQDIKERFSTPATELFAYHNRPDLQPELDIDLPSMGRVV